MNSIFHAIYCKSGAVQVRQLASTWWQNLDSFFVPHPEFLDEAFLDEAFLDEGSPSFLLCRFSRFLTVCQAEDASEKIPVWDQRDHTEHEGAVDSHFNTGLTEKFPAKEGSLGHACGVTRGVLWRRNAKKLCFPNLGLDILWRYLVLPSLLSYLFSYPFIHSSLTLIASLTALKMLPECGTLIIKKKFKFLTCKSVPLPHYLLQISSIPLLSILASAQADTGYKFWKGILFMKELGCGCIIVPHLYHFQS